VHPLASVVFAAAFATVATLASGIASMAVNGQVGRRNSVQWMMRRVGLQAVAFFTILVILLGSS